MKFARSTPRGFTLVELMIVVAVVAILAAVAYPSYTRYVARGHRNAVKAQVASAQQWLERSYSDNYGYPIPSSFPTSYSTNYYTVALSGTASAITQTYTLTVTRVSTSSMASDACGDLSVTQAGVKTVSGYASSYTSAAQALTDCWQ